MRNNALLEAESRGCFNYFWQEANTDINSDGFGLIRDRAPGSPDISSVASVGFGLSALVIGVERGWITRDQGGERALGTLDTLLTRAAHVQGFFYHFLHMETAKRVWGCEVSIIDTAIALNGAITAGEYFGGGVMEKARLLFERVRWDWYRDPHRNQFYMGYSPEKGFSGWWDFYAEQLMVYILGAGSPVHPVPGDMFYGFIRHGLEDRQGFIHSWFGSLFTHQFTHAWVDFRNKVDQHGVNWWENSIKAAQANRAYCIERGVHFHTLHGQSWGLTPCDGPWGYHGRYGAAPSAYHDEEHYIDGTIPPAGALGSIPFTPQESMAAANYYYEKHPRLWGRYGFMDAYNLDSTPVWYAEGVIGIDKGISLLMIENHRTGLIWDLYMGNTWVRAGLEKTGLQDMPLPNTHIA